jgi:hypothetical protein
LHQEELDKHINQSATEKGFTQDRAACLSIHNRNPSFLATLILIRCHEQILISFMAAALDILSATSQNESILLLDLMMSINSVKQESEMLLALHFGMFHH